MAENNSQYSILEAAIISSSATSEDNMVDIKSNVIELQFWEHIGKPYIDARIVFIDDMGLKEALGIQGTERIRIVIGDAQHPEEPAIIKYFYFANIAETERLNERSEMLSVNLVEEHVYVDAVKQFSRSYTANLEDIIESICNRDLGKGVERWRFKGSVQGQRKIIVPYMSPIAAIQWLKIRATTKIGSPIYLYSSLYQDELVMSDLDNLLSEDVINGDMPFRYSKALQASDDPRRNLYEIIEFNETGSDNSLSLYESGAIGSLYSNLDAGTGNSVDDHMTIRDIIDEFYTNGLISPESIQSIYDPTLLIDGKLSDEYNSMHIHQVTSSGTYNQFPSYHDETTLLDGNNDIVESRLKVKNKIIRAIMKKNMLDIGMNGTFFFSGSVGVGNKVRLLFLSSNAEGDNKDFVEQIDMRKSGDYFIIAINHKLTSEKNITQLRLSKLGELPDDFKL
tara:strand:+ start:1233 stop:2588 length:1356 start_codon:yes stop_codon:yes gene_type:complete